MSSESFTYKGISAGKYIEGEIEAINLEEASFKLKDQKIIITNIVKAKKKKRRQRKEKKQEMLKLQRKFKRFLCKCNALEKKKTGLIKPQATKSI